MISKLGGWGEPSPSGSLAKTTLSITYFVWITTFTSYCSWTGTVLPYLVCPSLLHIQASPNNKFHRWVIKIIKTNDEKESKLQNLHHKFTERRRIFFQWIEDLYKGPSKQSLQARLEEYPEFEYLRNILFQYMCGRQPLILVKVLSAIVKFTPEQVGISILLICITTDFRWRRLWG